MNIPNDKLSSLRKNIFHKEIMGGLLIKYKFITETEKTKPE